MKSTKTLAGLTVVLLATCANQAEREPASLSTAPAPPGSRTAQQGFPVKRLEPVGREGEIHAAASTQRRFSQQIAWSGPVSWFVIDPKESEQRETFMTKLATRRAYDGAPPPMPHSANFGTTRQTCLDCHTEGMALTDRVGRAMPHAELTACTQCHIESKSWAFPAAEPIVNTFAPLPSAPAPARLTGEAPPPITHSLHMRGRCLSCHGEFGYEGLRTEHHRRASCTQCHVPARDVEVSSPFTSK